MIERITFFFRVRLYRYLRSLSHARLIIMTLYTYNNIRIYSQLHVKEYDSNYTTSLGELGKILLYKSLVCYLISRNNYLTDFNETVASGGPE